MNEERAKKLEEFVAKYGIEIENEDVRSTLSYMAGSLDSMNLSKEEVQDLVSHMHKTSKRLQGDNNSIEETTGNLQDKRLKAFAAKNGVSLDSDAAKNFANSLMAGGIENMDISKEDMKKLFSTLKETEQRHEKPKLNQKIIDSVTQRGGQG